MKVLIVGSGGREHAIAMSAAKSSKVDKMYCAPGNAGIAEYAECVAIGAMEFDKLVAFAKEKEIDLVIVGMDDPLVGGLVDELEAAGIRTFGPRKNAAILEGSKAFSKDLMKKYDIPTAGYENFTDPEAAIAYLETAKFPIVLKADGLALGKGVLICQNLEEAKEGVKTIMLDKKFGTAGNEMVIEEFMTGREVSVLSFVDGKTIKIMTSAQDHKRASPSAFNTIGYLDVSRYFIASSGESKFSYPAVGILYFFIKSFEKAFEPSRMAAFFLGPNTLSPASSNLSTIPPTNGSSIPITVKSISFSFAKSTNLSNSIAPMFTHSAT